MRIVFEMRTRQFGRLKDIQSPFVIQAGAIFSKSIMPFDKNMANHTI